MRPTQAALRPGPAWFSAFLELPHLTAQAAQSPLSFQVLRRILTNVAFITEAFAFCPWPQVFTCTPILTIPLYLLTATYFKKKKKRKNPSWVSRSQSPLFLASPCLTPWGQNFLTMQRLASAADVSDKDAAFAHSGRSCLKSVLAHVLGLSLQFLPLLNCPPCRLLQLSLLTSSVRRKASHTYSPSVVLHGLGRSPQALRREVPGSSPGFFSYLPSPRPCGHTLCPSHPLACLCAQPDSLGPQGL